MGEDLRGDHSGYHSGFRSLRKVVASWMEFNFLQVLPLPCDALNAVFIRRGNLRASDRVVMMG